MPDPETAANWEEVLDNLQDEVADLHDIRSRVYDLATAGMASPGYERDFLEHILALTEFHNESED